MDALAAWGVGRGVNRSGVGQCKKQAGERNRAAIELDRCRGSIETESKAEQGARIAVQRRRQGMGGRSFRGHYRGCQCAAC